jgi:membrane fusion protein, multidrug efflux system
VAGQSEIHAPKDGDTGLNEEFARGEGARRRFHVHERSDAGTRSALTRTPDTKALQTADAESARKSRSPASKASATAPRRPLVRRIMFALLPIAMMVGGYWYVKGGQIVSVDDAYVEADKVGVSTDVAGIVKDIDITENQHVEAGQVLYRLNDLAFQYALNRAEAQLGTVRDSLNVLKANYQDMESQIQQAQNDLDYYTTEFNRQRGLLEAHVASQSAFEAAHRNLQNARQKLASLNHQLEGVSASLDDNPTGPVENNPRYLEAVAQRDETARQLAHTVVKAPFSGIVTDVSSIAPGKYLQASTTAFHLVSTDHVWVVANPKETELTNIRPGQPATVVVDAYPDYRGKGAVESISPAAAQEFSLLPAQNTSGNWVKVVQRIPMRVRVDTSNKSMPPPRAGMSVEVEVNTGKARGLPHFLTTLFGGSGQEGNGVGLHR